MGVCWGGREKERERGREEETQKHLPAINGEGRVRGERRERACGRQRGSNREPASCSRARAVALPISATCKLKDNWDIPRGATKSVAGGALVIFTTPPHWRLAPVCYEV